MKARGPGVDWFLYETKNVINCGCTGSFHHGRSRTLFPRLAWVGFGGVPVATVPITLELG